MSPELLTQPPTGLALTLVLPCGPELPATPLSAIATAVASGNRCGHIPTAPRFFRPPETHAPHPRILVRLQEAIEAYFNDPTCLPTLNSANGSPRNQRSERRESSLAFLGTLIHYLDLASLRIGLPKEDGGFLGLSMEFLAERAGLGLRRAERACRDLVAAGILTISHRVEATAEGGYRGLPAIREITTALFKIFGLEKWLQHEREKAAKRQKRRQQRQENARAAADAGRQALALNAAQRRAQTAAPSLPVAPTPQPTPTSSTPLPARPNQAARETARAALGNLLKSLRGGPPDSSG